MGADNGTYRTKDERYVQMIGLFPHMFNALTSYLQCANNAQAIQAAVEKYSAQQLEDEVAAGLNLALGMVRTPQEWLAHPQGAATAKLPLFGIDQQGTAKERVLGNAQYRPLEGVRVVDLTNVVAGPTAGFALAEQGADVIAVHAPRGDWVTPIWLSVNWGKKNILTDIKSPDGRKRFVDLLASADVLISSQRPGALDRLGLGEAELREINPNLVYGSESFASPGTPWAGRRGFEQIAQAVSGTMHVHSEGLALDAPTVTPGLMNDHLTGYLLAIAVVAALAGREEQGGFWRVDASLTRTSMFGNEFVGPVDDEPYAPVTEQDLIEHGWTRSARGVPSRGSLHRSRSAIHRRWRCARPRGRALSPTPLGGRRTRQAMGHRRCRTIRRSWCGRAAFAISCRTSASRIAGMAAASSASFPSRRP